MQPAQAAGDSSPEPTVLPTPALSPSPPATKPRSVEKAAPEPEKVQTPAPAADDGDDGDDGDEADDDVEGGDDDDQGVTLLRSAAAAALAQVGSVRARVLGWSCSWPVLGWRSRA